MRISDWSSDVCSSDLAGRAARRGAIARISLPEIIGEGVALLELVVILQIAAAELDSEIVLLPFGRQAALLDGIGVLLRLTDGDVRSDDRRIGPARRITFGTVIVHIVNRVRTGAVDLDDRLRMAADSGENE